ncbi:hypothetical protein [Streptomyces sp. NBC_01565]|uniref:hypothetical protein n=1 Tax=unclassified Streptomyces TaxID=2593676 RepID=UPI00225349A9|nr:hypothetical protein [Streptomyces sp. NBC_01565]MCX4546508.1 hypothetical protein [Streptomyces sp. NBC_01565]
MCSPPTWGWTDEHEEHGEGHRVLPADAGVDRRACFFVRRAAGVPADVGVDRC